MVYQAIAITQRILLELWRQKRSLILWVAFPICLLVLNGLVLAEGAKISSRESFEIAAPATVVGAALFFSCLGGTISTIVAERESRTLKRLLLSPLRGTAYFLGILGAYTCIGVGQTLLVYTIASFWQVSFKGAVWLGVLIVLASIAAYVGIGFLLGTKLARRTEDINALVAGIGVPLLILGGAFFPTSFLPENLLLLAQFNPVYHMNSALLGVSAEGKGLEDGNLVIHLRFLLGFVAVAIMAGGLAYRRLLLGERQL
jgi:ABC-2 type transport system permease protein